MWAGQWDEAPHTEMAWKEGREGRPSTQPGGHCSLCRAERVCRSSIPSNVWALAVYAPNPGQPACHPPPHHQPTPRPALSNPHYHKCLAFLPGNSSSHSPVRIRA